MRKTVMGSGRRPVLVGFAGAAVLTAAACGGGGGHEKHEATTVAITPTRGAQKVHPDKPVVVQAAHGTLGDVVLRSGSKRLPGVYNSDHTRWRSKWALKPGASFTVRADAKQPGGDRVTATSAFTTLKPEHTVSVSQDSVLEAAKGDTYGVGLPIVLHFSKKVHNKAAVERALQVTAQKSVPGAWRWVDDEEVVYRAKTYWPAHQTVRLTAHLAGVQVADGVYGTENYARTYKIGKSQIAYLDLKKDKMRVKWDGELVRRVPISAGMGGSREYTTTSGIHLAMEKAVTTIMTSPGRSPGDAGYYSEPVHYTVRISGLGEYLHQTPGSAWCLGHQNCSHGCVRQPKDDAIWYYKHSQPGDPVVSVGTDRQLQWNNGWGFYQMPWDKWQQGSALHQANTGTEKAGVTTAGEASEGN